MWIGHLAESLENMAFLHPSDDVLLLSFHETRFWDDVV
jgi:hypothetical protein